MLPSRITGPVNGQLLYPGALRRLLSIVRFYLYLGLLGILLVFLFYLGLGLSRLGRAIVQEPQNLPVGVPEYLLIAWGVVTAAFVILYAWRNVLSSSHEDDQIFLGSAQEARAREQHNLVQRITSLSWPLLLTGALSGALLLIVTGFFLYQGLRAFF